MFKKFFIIFLLIFSINSVQVYAENAVTSQLERIENEMWGFSYNQENDIQRLERIEKQIFGTTNPKITPDKRVDKITKSLGFETLEEAKSSLNDLYITEKADESVEYPQIDRLEGAILGNTYKNENIYLRLERLEKKVFGAKQEGDLAQRTEALKRHSQIGMENEAPSNSYQENYTPYRYQQNTSDIKLQLAAIENMIFSTDFSNEPVQLRLNRLENRIFQRDFNEDEDSTRISRIQAAANASRTAKHYDNNKFQKFAATGLQAASFLLMLLAFIL